MIRPRQRHWLVFLLGWLLLLPSAWADEGGDPLLPLAPAQQQQADALGRILRCPVCQGMPILDSPSPMAQDMRKKIRALLAAGQTPEQVKAYFVSRYGDWVLLEPEFAGVTAAVWLLPPLVFLALMVLLWRYVAAPRRAPLPANHSVGALSTHAASTAADKDAEQRAKLAQEVDA